MDQELEIRRLGAGDIEAFYPLFEQMLREDIDELKDRSKFFLEGDYTRDRVYSSLIFPKIIIIGAFVNQKLIGFVWGSATYAGLGFISWLKVDADYQGKGIGKKLVHSYEKSVRNKKGHVIELYCFDSTLGFYTKLGFEKIGIRKKGYFKLRQNILNKYLT